MKEYLLDGEKYLYNNGKWFTSNYHSVPQGMYGKLNKLLLEQEDFSEKSLEELAEIINGTKIAENTGLTSKALEAAIEKANIEELRRLLPQLTSNLRKRGLSKEAVSQGERYLEEYGKRVQSTALFTSLAAAYCDLKNPVKAKQYANRAHALGGGQSSPELINVYSRIKSMQ